MNLEILADLKRLRDDLHTLNDIVYGTHRMIRNGEDPDFGIKSLIQRMTVIIDTYNRIVKYWEEDKKR